MPFLLLGKGDVTVLPGIAAALTFLLFETLLLELQIIGDYQVDLVLCEELGLGIRGEKSVLNLWTGDELADPAHFGEVLFVGLLQ